MLKFLKAFPVEKVLELIGIDLVGFRFLRISLYAADGYSSFSLLCVCLFGCADQRKLRTFLANG